MKIDRVICRCGAVLCSTGSLTITSAHGVNDEEMVECQSEVMQIFDHPKTKNNKGEVECPLAGRKFLVDAPRISFFETEVVK